MYDVITFGSATRDVFLRSKAMELHKEHGSMEACFLFGAKLNVEDIVLETGGGATNNAVTFSRMAGLKTAAVCRIGDDSMGDDVIESLRDERVSPEFVQRDRELKTGYSTVILSGQAERTILTYRGAASETEERLIPWNKIRARLFHLSNLGGNLALLEKIIGQAQKTGAQIYMNPGNAEFIQGLNKLFPLFRNLDLLIVNREEAAVLTGRTDKNLKGLFSGLRQINRRAVLTDGSKGAYSISPAGVWFADIISKKQINLTGAGDAFGSAFAAAMLKYDDERLALAMGTVNATSVIHNMGAKVGILRGMPSRAEIAKVKIKKISL